MSGNLGLWDIWDDWRAIWNLDCSGYAHSGLRCCRFCDSVPSEVGVQITEFSLLEIQTYQILETSIPFLLWAVQRDAGLLFRMEFAFCSIQEMLSQYLLAWNLTFVVASISYSQLCCLNRSAVSGSCILRHLGGLQGSVLVLGLRCGHCNCKQPRCLIIYLVKSSAEIFASLYG